MPIDDLTALVTSCIQFSRIQLFVSLFMRIYKATELFTNKYGISFINFWKSIKLRRASSCPSMPPKLLLKRLFQSDSPHILIVPSTN
jgi:hypothetical protein